MQLYSDIYHSPIGEILMLADGDHLCFLDFNDNDDRVQKMLKSRFGKFTIKPKENLLGMQDRMESYFNEDWSAFDDLAMRSDGTNFQETVWQSLMTIPVGEAISYDQLANAIDNPRAVRAVASANARNPIAIIVPCHRVIGKDGSMRGYAGGIERKIWLLNHEGFGDQKQLF